jgi:EpsI family protein
VILYVGFFRDLAAILEVHTPELCYPAQGWEVLSLGQSVTGTFRGMRVPAMQIVVDKNGERRLVVWWYSTRSRPFESRIRYVYAMLAMSMFTGRTEGSMIRLETPLDGDGEAAARARTSEFQRRFLVELDKALPE